METEIRRSLLILTNGSPKEHKLFAHSDVAPEHQHENAKYFPIPMIYILLYFVKQQTID